MQKVREFFPRVIPQSLRRKAAFPVVLMLPFLLVIFAGLLGDLMLARAADEPPALGAALIALLNVIKDKAAAAVVVMHIFQVLRTNEVIGILGKIGLQGKALKVTIAFLTAGGYVAAAYGTSGNLGAALIEGLFTAGGAMLLFDAFKASSEAVAVKQGETVLAALAKKRGSLA